MPVTITPPAGTPAPPSPAAVQTVAQVTSQAPQAQPAPILPPVPGDGKTAVGATLGGHTFQPRVRFQRPPVAGEVIPDRGDEAEFEVLHVFVGDFPQGSRVKASDFPPGVDFDRLIRLGAVADLRPPTPPADAPAADAPTDPPAKSGKGK